MSFDPSRSRQTHPRRTDSSFSPRSYTHRRSFVLFLSLCLTLALADFFSSLRVLLVPTADVIPPEYTVAAAEGPAPTGQSSSSISPLNDHLPFLLLFSEIADYIPAEFQ